VCVCVCVFSPGLACGKCPGFPTEGDSRVFLRERRVEPQTRDTNITNTH